MTYVTMSIFCLIIMIFILIKLIITKSMNLKSRKYMIIFLAFLMAATIFDAFSGLVNDMEIVVPLWVINTAEGLYFATVGVATYFGFVLITTLDEKTNFKKKTYLIIAVPIIMYLILIFVNMFINYFTEAKWGIYYITEKIMYPAPDESTVAGAMPPEPTNGVTHYIYARGTLNFTQFMFTFFYLLIVFIAALSKIGKKKYISTRKVYFNTLAYVAIPVIGAIAQFVLAASNDGEDRQVNVPLLVAALTFSTIIIFIYLCQSRVERDYLTNCYTKDQFYNKLEERMVLHKKDLFLFMIDLNKFKYINDTFGHNEGDEALKLFSMTVREYVNSRGGNIFRYGGDEFTLIVELEEEKIEDYTYELRQAIDLIAEENNKSYLISASIGYVKYDESMTNIPDFVKMADDKMYIDKERFRSTQK